VLLRSGGGFAPLSSALLFSPDAPYPVEALDRLRAGRTPHVLVENRTSVGGNDLEFSVYDTYQQAQEVALHARNPLYCGMVTGRKVIHAPAYDPFDFLPGESLMVPAQHAIHIDFPDARRGEPTTCITLEIDRDRVQRILDRLNETAPRSPESGEWLYDDAYVHFPNTPAIERVLQTLVQLFTEDHAHKDALIDLNSAELIIRMLQTQAREMLIGCSEEHAASHGLAAAVQHVHRHLDRHISMDELADKAYMSKSTFYRYFGNEFGMTPLQYVNEQRMERAQELLQDGERTVTDVSYALGFSSVSHFIDMFKKHVGDTPKSYQQHVLGEKKGKAPE
jgi:AraC-like DNA-binding protein